MKIFLVEDNEELNHYMTEALTKIGYKVVSCIGNNLDEAFNIVEEYFDLYLIDINLPTLNGLELVKRIKAKRATSKVFIISGDDNINTILKAYDLGCDDYIKKPFDLREIVVKIDLKFQEKLENKVKISDDCFYDKKKKFLYHNGKIVTLTNKESILLNILVVNLGQIVSNETIEKSVWEKKSSNGHLRQLVSKLKKTMPCENVIHNHSSQGYGIII